MLSSDDRWNQSVLVGYPRCGIGCASWLVLNIVVTSDKGEWRFRTLSSTWASNSTEQVR